MHPHLLAGIIALAVFLFFFLAYLFLIAPGKKRKEMEKFKNVRYAHRGLHDNERAENTISAFRHAVDAGYGIELDVRLSSDGELVVFHDDDLVRACGIDARVDTKTASELKELKLFGLNEGVPALSEVLSLVGGKVPLLVEIKEDAGKYCVTEKTIEILSQYNGAFIIESFNPLALGVVKIKMPNVMRGVLSQAFLKEKKYRKPMYFLLQHLYLNVVCRPDFIAYNHEHYKNGSLKLCKLFGASALCWTVKSKDEEAAALKHGFTGIIFENYLA